MKHSRSIMLAMAVTLLAPLPLLAQAGGQGRGGMGGPGMAGRGLVEQGSVEFLVTKAAELGLAAEQKEGLAAIGAKWAEETKPSREKIRAEMPTQGMGGDRQAMMQRLQAIRPLLQELQAEDEKAVAEAMKLLTEAQQATAKKLLEERLTQRRPGGG
jgi:hypothetical protein